ncbi:alpha-amylase family glycosyl hydrolase [Kitasatospora sp. NPDC096147]|uniref:alpha-amylase family glycosyl hydrolase n=1 Tax=Kitasatospora sp. NPDC096147 TaxID=3364093 RepID=UPI0037F42412
MTSAQPRPPTASYRLQLQPAFTLHDARAAVPYLAALGVSHLHLSPLLEAAPGSTHGYDTVDHTRISEQLGGETALRALAAEARRHGLRLIADVVPNHMALPVPEDLNQPLWQVLRDGPDSPYAAWFDIDWAAQTGPADAPERGRVLLPVLGGRLGEVLDQLTVDGPVLRYHEHALPIRPGTGHLPLAELVRHQWYRPAWWRVADSELNYRRFFTVNQLIAVRVEVPEVFEATHRTLLRLHAEGVLDGFRIDHPDGLADPRGYLRRLAEATGGAYTVVEKILTGDELLPADWPCAGTTGYDALRRIDGVLTDPLGAERLVTAYRADCAAPAPARPPHTPARFEPARPTGAPWHGDAAAPAAPLRSESHSARPPGPDGGGTPSPARLQDGDRTAGAPAAPDPSAPPTGAPAARPGTDDRPAGAPAGEPAAGGSTHSGGVGRPPLPRPGTDESGSARPGTDDMAAEIRHGRAELLTPDGELSAELGRLVRLVGRICAAEPGLADHPAWAVREVLAELLTAYPVYRPYVVPGEPAPPEAVAGVTTALAGVPERLSGAAGLVRGLALGELGSSPAKDEFAARLGQTAAAVAAKGVEDTAFYRFNALLSLNEVGGSPTHPGLSPARFHAWYGALAEEWPHSMTALSTHDTKRSADARARLTVLAELPERWAAECAAWTTAAGPCPDRPTAWLLWQTLVAAWPITPERLGATLLKSVREAKRRTSWTDPDEEYEQAVLAYARAALADPALHPRIEGFVGSIAPYARSNSLAAALLHLTGPGVPDLYQGSEEPLHTLVDPDNRAPVDLSALAVRLTDSAAPRPDDPAREKLHLTATALHLRQETPEPGPYRPLTATGPAAGHLLAFARGEHTVTAVTRLPYGLERGGGWRSTALELPAGHWREELTQRRFEGGRVPAAELFAALPVALLVQT